MQPQNKGPGMLWGQSYVLPMTWGDGGIWGAPFGRHAALRLFHYLIFLLILLKKVRFEDRKIPNQVRIIDLKKLDR